MIERCVSRSNGTFVIYFKLVIGLIIEQTRDWHIVLNGYWVYVGENIYIFGLSILTLVRDLLPKLCRLFILTEIRRNVCFIGAYLFFAGVQKIMVPGTSVKSSKEALRLSRLYPGIIYSTAGNILTSSLWDHKKPIVIIAVGIHPHDSKSIIEEPKSWFEFENIAQSLECVAIGPCGLDFQRDFSEPDVQKEIFEKQIRLAAKLNKPLLIHERSAQVDVLDMLERFDELFIYFCIGFPIINTKMSYRFPTVQQIVIRSFMGTTEEAIKYLERGYYLGFTGYLCKVS